MDRTKEFLGIVQATEIPQSKPQEQPFYGDVTAKQREIESIIRELSKITSYESYRQQSLIEQAQQKLREYRAIQIVEGSSQDAKAVSDAVKQMIRMNLIRWAQVLSRTKKREKAVNIRAAAPELADAPPTAPIEERLQVQEQIEREVQHQDEEELQSRRRIVGTITEIGQLVDNVSLHLGLHEDMLRRLDDTTVRTEFWGIKALEELKGAWDTTSSNRKKMFYFFGFWMLLFILFWIVHR